MEEEGYWFLQLGCCAPGYCLGFVVDFTINKIEKS
jgi:hypothetical protein